MPDYPPECAGKVIVSFSLKSISGHFDVIARRGMGEINNEDRKKQIEEVKRKNLQELIPGV
jgi:hypothetical protein